MKDTFSSFHPAVNFIYFLAVIVFSMFFMHPIFLCISLICSIAYSVYLNGAKALKFNLLFMLPMLLLFAVMNPVFNHEGATILIYINDNPITLESIVYGFDVHFGHHLVFLLQCCDDFRQVYLLVWESDSGTVSSVVDGFAAGSQAKSADTRHIKCAKMYRQGRQQRKYNYESKKRNEDTLYFNDVGAGKRDRDGGFYEIEGIWAKGENQLFKL